MVTILLVEDDLTIANATKNFLIQNQFTVLYANSLQTAREQLDKHNISILLLDMMLPDGNALDFYKTIDPSIKVVFLTAVDDETIMIDTFRNGIEDYITKPFRLPLLLAKLQAIVMRNQLDKVQAIPYYHLTIDTSAQLITRDNHAVHLTKNEQKLFFYLFINRNKIVTREQLLTYLWDNSGDFVNDNTLSVTLKRLRAKIEKDIPLIETIRGIGYRLKGE